MNETLLQRLCRIYSMTEDKIYEQLVTDYSKSNKKDFSSFIEEMISTNIPQSMRPENGPTTDDEEDNKEV